MAPVAWVWNETTNTYMQFRSYADMLQYYTSGGGIEAYLTNFQNAGYYSSSPCFNRDCTNSENLPADSFVFVCRGRFCLFG